MIGVNHRLQLAVDFEGEAEGSGFVLSIAAGQGLFRFVLGI